MRRLALLLLLATVARSQDPAPPPPPIRQTSFQGAVNAAVERAVAWLRQAQKKDGNWKSGHSDTFPMGVTALVTLALLRSDVPPEDPAIAKAIEALQYLPIDKTYSTGLLLMVLEAVKGRDRHPEWTRRAAEFLIRTERSSGLWAYPENEADLSNSQFAIFGLFAATRMGTIVPRESWLHFTKRVLAMQHEDGGFPYRPDAMASGSMTAAGIASLLLCRQLDEKLKIGLPAREMDAAVEKGMGWLARRFRADRNPSGPTDGYNPSEEFWFYYLYAVERAAVLGGKPRLGDHDWYREGAVELIRRQNPKGHWGDVVKTSFALLFLKRASLTYSSHAKEFEGDPKALLPIDANAPQPDLELQSVTVAKEVPFLRRWLTLGPFPNPDDKLLNEDPIKEDKILPVAGLRTGRLEWKEFEASKDFVDLDAAIGKTDDVVGYACCYLWAESDFEAILWFGSDEGAKVLLNRECVLYEHRHDVSGKDATRVRVKIKKGRNLVLVKVEEQRHWWGFHARLSDPAGRPLSVRATLSPDK